MKKYSVEVWFRYAAYGELEKDFDVYDIEATTPEEAITIAMGKRKGIYKIHIKN